MHMPHLVLSGMRFLLSISKKGCGQLDLKGKGEFQRHLETQGQGHLCVGLGKDLSPFH